MAYGLRLTALAGGIVLFISERRCPARGRFFSRGRSPGNVCIVPRLGQWRAGVSLEELVFSGPQNEKAAN